MVLDWDLLGGGSSEEAITEPRKVFSTLPKKSPKFKFLHDVQAQVLDQWFERRGEKDLVLKMNTGSGKTLVGLLLLLSSLNEKKGPAIYVAPDKFLVDQVIEEAQALGIPATTNDRDGDFLAGKAILIVNVYKLFNGRSVFGVGKEGRKIKIGTVVIDDAHACLTTVKDQFAIRASSEHPLYQALLPLFGPELERQSPATFLDIKAQDPQAVMLVPFWVWQDQQVEIIKVIHEHRGTKELMFNWQLIAEVLKHCRCVIGGGYLEIAPRCLPIDVVPSFDEATRRIHMTATLAEDSVLITEFQANPNSVSTPITPSSAADIGDRMILAPQEINPDISDEAMKVFVQELSKHHNVTVIVPSKHRSEFWDDVASQTLMGDAIWEGVSKLKKGAHIGMTVLINRYDGIDLPDDACRVLVLDGLPESLSLLEREDAIALDGTEATIARQIQRIEQGMGRGVRSNDDYCVVLLMGSRLVQRLHSPEGRSKFTPGTLAQLDLAKKVAAQIQGKGLDELRQAIDLCLARNAGWVSVSKKAVVGAVYVKKNELNPVAVAQREAFDQWRIQQPDKAAGIMQKAVNDCHDNRTKGWLMVQLAEIKHRPNPVEAQAVLLAAIKHNKFITRPIEGITYDKLLPPNMAQALSVVAYLKPKFLEGNELVLAINSIVDDLIFQPDTSNAFESAVKAVGELLGFGSQRPEAEFGKGPDNLWAIGGNKYFVIECKNGATVPHISKHDSDQLSGSINWFGEKYEKSGVVTPVMIHWSHTFGKHASPAPGTRIIDKSHIEALKRALRLFAGSLASNKAYLDADKVGELLKHHNFLGERFLDIYSTQFKKQG